MLKAMGAIVIGVGFLIAAAFSVQSTREFLRTSIVVPGRVVKLNAGGYHPEIEFVTKSGEHVSYPQGGILIAAMEVGQDVEVRYLPEQPIPTATVNTFRAIWDMPIFLATMGLGAILVGLMNLPSRK
ncbi:MULTISPECIES: DUF3592 domain-containing protein [Burkholderia cepacia complex]|uniref:DUF3592 domain-containing protein n=1 Tax=Burkholderia cepacia complex TaxID=87882 RepID=UPI0006A64C3C|nr:MULTISPECIES: DUF3592 domain-containing protein [Burkholderia cepacia complex]MBO2975401.1 DUF3592 domain-containing protein [Burkholderia pseudomallei]KOE25234.1 hypothetical protein AI46_14450 [Burkholderia multivorans R-20526]MBU9304569.1 DUF3592 domain-containing protein [Burkholderia multivorans]MBU9509615.1 DUF3592 domain-containing protein [Burkholderia multivorans]PRE05485.1 DUF3592 domain-containing protein [Burkholderia multivorans]